MARNKHTAQNPVKDDHSSILFKDPEDAEGLMLQWRHLAAYTYLIICLFDFLIMPSIFQKINYIRPSEAIELSLKFDDPENQRAAFAELQSKDKWEPLTLLGAGTFHLAFGAILGATAWTRGKERIDRVQREYDFKKTKVAARVDNPDA